MENNMFSDMPQVSAGDADASSSPVNKKGLAIVVGLTAVVVGLVIYTRNRHNDSSNSQQNNQQQNNQQQNNSNQQQKNLQNLPPLPTPNFDPDDPAYKLDLVLHDVLVNNWTKGDNGIYYAELGEQKDYGFDNTDTVGAYRVLNATDKPIAVNVAEPNPQGMPPWVWSGLMLSPSDIPKQGIFFDKAYGSIRIATKSSESPRVRLKMSDAEPVINLNEKLSNESFSPVEGNVCESQSKFNDAVAYALWTNENKLASSTSAIAFGVIWILLLFWSIRLAIRNNANVADNAQKNIQMCLAIVFPPIYIVAHYLNSNSM